MSVVFFSWHHCAGFTKVHYDAYNDTDDGKNRNDDSDEDDDFDNEEQQRRETAPYTTYG